MKLCQLSVILLLLPLVSADLRPNVVAKVMHKDDYFIGEGVNTRRIQHSHVKEGLSFALQNSTYYLTNYMIVTSDYKTPLKEVEFVVEMFDEESMRGVSCIEKSEEHLRSQIHYCFGSIAIRELTYEESREIQQYQQRQKKSQEAFRVVHEHDNIRTESFGQTELRTFVTREVRGQGKEIYARSDVDGADVRQMWLRNTKTDTPLVIIGHPKGSGVDCHHLESPDLQVESCTGDVSARRMN